MNNKRQIEMDLTPGLNDQFPELMDLIAAVIYGSRIGLSGVAAAIDKSPSLLSRMLNRNPDEQRNLPLADLPKIVEATGDHRIIHWLIEKYCEDKDVRQKRQLEEIASLLPHLQNIVARAKTQ